MIFLVRPNDSNYNTRHFADIVAKWLCFRADLFDTISAMFFAYALLATVLTRVSDLASAVAINSTDCNDSFCVTGTVSYVIHYHENIYHVLLEDGAIGVDTIGETKAFSPHPGDTIRLSGKIARFGPTGIKPIFRNIEKLCTSSRPPAREASAEEIMSGRHDFHRAYLIGEVRDVVPSGTDPCWNYVSIIAENRQYYAPVPTRGANLDQLLTHIGSTVKIDGYPDSHNCSFRFLDERRFMFADMDHITVLSSPPRNPFDKVPSISELHRLPSETIARLGRHKAIGQVLSTWQKQNALIRLNDGRMAFVAFSGNYIPLRGQTIEVIGYPSTDGFSLSLDRALARPIEGCPFVEPPVMTLSSDDIKNMISPTFRAKDHIQGRRIRICGTVANINDNLRKRGIFSLSIAGRILDVDISSLQEEAQNLVIGCFVRITGTCVLSTENWSTISKGIQLDGIRLILDTKGDLEILAFPSWWTPTRLVILVCILVFFLAGCLAWNRLLHRLSEKRGRELFNERSASALAELKTEERTRLAVELHDSISQILTGAAMQLDAGEIGAAKRILASCRRELRNCLWELRSHAIDAANFADAIRETIYPHLGERHATVDIDIPSSSLSEGLRHAALRIIREATINAVRHGHATLIAICGELIGEKLSFTIVDNGRGFNPSEVQGSATGHFGLLGMRERAKSFNGIINIISAPGNGTEISVVLEECNSYDFDDKNTNKDTIRQ